MHQLIQYFVIFFCSGVLAVYVLVWLLLKSPLVKIFRDKPGTRKIHQNVIPRAGGICIVTSFIMLVYVWHLWLSPVFPSLPNPLFQAVVLIAIGIFAIGFSDDTVSFVILNKAKFLLEVLLACEVVFMFGIHFHKITLFNHSFELGFFGPALSILWLVGVANAFNIIDGIDTLAGSTSIISFITLALFASFTDSYSIVILCILLAGLSTGFLFHNISPARIFLGDTGSLFFGMIIATLSMYLVSQVPANSSILILPCIIALPLLDVSVAMVRRFIKRILAGDSFIAALKAMTVADNEHLHHRLVHRGLTHLQSSLLLGIFSVTCCISTFLMLHFWVFELVILAYLAGVTYWLLYRLDIFNRILNPRQHNRTATQDRPDRDKVAVINADDILTHAFTYYTQNRFEFVFLKNFDAVNDSLGYAAIIYNHPLPDLSVTEHKICLDMSEQLHCPLVIIADNDETLKQGAAENEQSRLFYFKKPFYVPVLMAELYNLVKTYSIQQGKLKQTRINFRFKEITG